MTIQHSVIPDAQRHEPKGASTAANNTTYVSNGLASGTWKKIPTQGLEGITSNGVVGDHVGLNGAGGYTIIRKAHGSIYFVDLAAPYVLTYPATYTKLAPTTVAVGDPTEITEATTSRLTYTGVNSKHIRIIAQVSASQSIGSNRDLQFALFKNGTLVPGAEVVSTTTSAEKQSAIITFSAIFAPTEYVEVFCKNTGVSGDVSIYTLHLCALSLNDVN
jgi:hypothetical protein